MSNLSYETDSKLFDLFMQIQFLNNLDSKIQSLFGETDSSVLDNSIDSLLEVFLYFSEANKHLADYELDEVVDIIFDSNMKDVEKFDKVMAMIDKEKEGDVT